jgi:hypothetical protein
LHEALVVCTYQAVICASIKANCDCQLVRCHILKFQVLNVSSVCGTLLTLCVFILTLRAVFSLCLSSIS